jgi:hypothetical protein
MAALAHFALHSPMSVTLATTTDAAGTPSSDAKPPVMLTRTLREPSTSLTRSVDFTGATEKDHLSSTSGTDVGLGLWLGVDETDVVVEADGVRVSEGVLVSEGEAESEAVLVVDSVGVMLIEAVSEGDTEIEADGVEEGGRMHVPLGASQYAHGFAQVHAEAPAVELPSAGHGEQASGEADEAHQLARQ